MKRTSTSPAPSRSSARASSALPILPANSYDLFPSSIVCSCGQAFYSDWSTDDDKTTHIEHSSSSFVGSALWLFLRHQSCVLVDPSCLTQPHLVTFLIMSCVECSISVDMDDYKEHLESAHGIDCRQSPPRCRGSGRVSSWLAPPFLQCAACREKSEAMDVMGALAHSHDTQRQQRFVLMLACRACGYRVPIDHAIEHAALWHPERLQRSSDSAAAIADLFVTAPKMRPIPAGVDAIYPISDRVDESNARGSGLLKSKKSVFNVKSALTLPLSADNDSADNAIPLDSTIEAAHQLSPDCVQAAADDEATTSDGGKSQRQESPESPPVGVSESVGESGEIVRTFDNLATVHITKYRCLSVAKGHDSTAVVVARMQEPGGAYATRECELCGKRFAKPAEWEPHMWRHTGVRPFGCHHCSQRFLNRNHVGRHVQAIHIGVTRRFECNQCGKKFKRKENLTYHGLSHTGKKVCQCPVCQKWFQDVSRLRRHKRQVHEAIPQARYNRDKLAHTCPTCSMEFKSVAELDRHCNREHHSVARFACGWCGRKFSHRQSLRAHEREHTGERFRCRYCDNDFEKKNELTRHVRQCRMRDF